MNGLFVVFTDERYSELCRVLLDGLNAFSTAGVLVVGVGFDFNYSHPRLNVKRVDFVHSGICDFSMIRLEYLTRIPGPFVMLDADMIPNWNIDELISLCEFANPSLQQTAVCGSFHDKVLEILNPMIGFPFCNMVPLIAGNGFSRWVSNLWPSFMECDKIHREIHSGESIDDEKAMNWVRCMSQQSSKIGIVSSDRSIFPVYLSGEIGNHKKMTALYDGNRHVAWHLFHGEKDPIIARQMLQEIEKRGPDFLYRNAWCNRKPKVFS